MTLETHRQWLVRDRPIGRALRAEDFGLVKNLIGRPADGQVLVQTQFLSFDPAQKSWMENIANYKAPVEIGSVMPGSGAGCVLESRHPDFVQGDLVHGPLGWQERAVVDGSELAKTPQGVPITAALGVLGATGKTAYLDRKSVV